MTHHGIGHMVASSLVHGVIYSTIYHAMRGLTLGEDIAVCAVVVGVIWLLSTKFSQQRW